MTLDKLSKELEKPFIPKKKEYEKTEESDITKKEFYSKVIDFTNRIKKSYGDLIKSVLIFGSAARGDMKSGSDVDLWVVVDDTATKSSEDINRIKANMQLLTTELKGLHVQINSLTDFWGWMKLGSPELFNYLRVGLVIYDTGFIKPVQRMLKLGLLPPSEETVGLKTRSADAIVKRVEAGMKAMIFDLRYAATDACQSVIMYYYKETPDQKNMIKWLNKLVEENKLEKGYIDKFSELDQLWKDIDHKKIEKIEVKHLQRAMELATDIIGRMKKILPKDLQEYDSGGLI